MKPRALVTGATGIVGAHLVRALVRGGHEVRALVRPASDRRALEGVPVELCEGDVMQPVTLAHAVQGCEWVFHAAAVYAYSGISADHQTELAVRGTRNVLEAAARAGARRVIVTSSSVTLGSAASARVLDEQAVFAEADPCAYTLSKVRQEKQALDDGQRLGLDVVAVCPTLVLGPLDYRLGPSNANLVNYLNDPLRCTFPGGCNVVAAADVAQAHLVAARCGAPGARYVAGSENLHWEDLHRTVSELAGTFGPALTLNHTAAFLAGAGLELAARLAGRRPTATREEARMACRFYWYSNERLAKLGWHPRPARQTLAEALAWVLLRGHVADTVVSRLRPAREVRLAVER
jgi:dihydroflavonol-4-reductase